MVGLTFLDFPLHVGSLLDWLMCVGIGYKNQPVSEWRRKTVKQEYLFAYTRAGCIITHSLHFASTLLKCTDPEFNNSKCDWFLWPMTMLWLAYAVPRLPGDVTKKDRRSSILTWWHSARCSRHNQVLQCRWLVWCFLSVKRTPTPKKQKTTSQSINDIC